MIASLSGAVACATSKAPVSGPPTTGGASAASEAAAQDAPSVKIRNDQLLAREVPSLSIRPLASPDGRFSGQVEAAAAPGVVRAEGAWKVSIPLGTNTPVECFIYDTPYENGVMVGDLINFIREQNKNGTIESIVPTDAGAVGEAPYLTVLVTHTKPDAAAPTLVQVKLFVRSDYDGALTCWHDDVGYRETFKRVTLGLARTLEVKVPRRTRQYVEILVARLGAMPLAVTRRSIESNEKKEKLDTVVTTALVPVGPGQLQVRDVTELEESNAAGRVTWVASSTRDGDKVATFKLSRKGAGREYEVKGTHEGNELSESFTSKEKEGFPSKTLLARRLRDAFVTGKARELKVELYDENVSPLAPVEITYRAGAKAGDVSWLLGTTEVIGHLDERGMLDKYVIPRGDDGETRCERVYVRGKP